MKIATHNSEKLLLADLREARIGNPNHRCLFLRLSQAAEPMNVWLPKLDKASRHTLGDTIDQIYLTHDGDVFILGWGLTQLNVQDLVFNLSETLGADSLKNLARLFEIGIHWNELESLCVSKIRKLDVLQSKNKTKKQNNEKKLSTDEALSHLDMTLIETISKRRQSRKNIEILIVEDDLFSQTLIKKVLGDRYSLSMARDGKGALFSFVKTAPDIVFLDIELPDINGHAVLQKIRSIDPNAYIVMFSGNGDRENILKAIDLGAQGFVGKPFTKEKLFQYIDKSPFVNQKIKSTILKPTSQKETV
jgi:two-component system chemotaxis response regulator CheY